MKKATFAALLALAYLFGCDDSNVYKQEEFSGNVFYKDDVLNTVQKIASEATIYIADNQEAEPFFNQYKASKEGDYSIEFVPKQGKVFVIGEWEDSRGILFKGSKTYESGEDLILYPRYPSGKVKVTVKDASMQPVNGVDVYLFVNESLAGSVAAGDPKGFIKKETTNENGIAFFYDLGPKDYYVAGRREKQWFVAQKTTTSVGNNDFTTINSINATISTPTSPIQLIVTVNDEAGKPMFGSEVFIFTSEKQAETVKSTKKPTGVIATQLTNMNGKASFNALEYNKDYFVVARDSLFDATIMITPPTILNQMKAAYSIITPVKTNSQGVRELEKTLIIR